MRAASALDAVRPTGLAIGDWRVTLMASLVDYDALEGEWDPERQLIIPRSDGPLARVGSCDVMGCSHLRYGASALCSFHRRQFAAATTTDLDAWLESGEPGAQRRRRFSEELCVVGADGRRCLRPAVGTSDLCRAHDAGWRGQHAGGVSLEKFLTEAHPLPGYRPCAAASCHLGATHGRTALCEAHDRMWRADGLPTGRAFTSWAARVRQPSNGRVLSLRGLPELVRLELLYVVGCRVRDQIRTATNVHPYLDRLRAAGVPSVLDYDLRHLEADGDRNHARFARYCVDRVRLAYAAADTARREDIWDLRLFGRSGRKHLDFRPIRQPWLSEATKAWAADALLRVRAHETVQHRVQSVAVLSGVLASGPGGGDDPRALGRADIDRFLARVGSALSPRTGRPYSTSRAAGIIVDCTLVLREAREMGLLGGLGATFTFRRHDGGQRVPEEHPGRALPSHVVAQLDATLDRLRATPGSSGASRPHSPGVLGEHAGTMAVLAYELLKGTGRRVGEIASLHLECLEIDEHDRPVLLYDNHKTARAGRRLPLADAALVGAIRAQQAWVAERFRDTPAERLWLLPRASKNTDGTAHLGGGQIAAWMRSWVAALPSLDAGTIDEAGCPVPFDRALVHPHAFRHTWAQSLADQGVPFAVLRDLMDHRSPSATLGYYRVGEARKREAMDLLARHTIDSRGTARPGDGPCSPSGALREQLSWVAVPMGKCAEPTNVRAGGQACPIRYQCAACPHFESDPSFLPELRVYADDLRHERETMLAAGAAEWVVENVARQLEVIRGHVRHHEEILEQLPVDQRALVEDASVTVRKARQSVPVAFGRRGEGGHG
jgi:integrase